MAGRESYSRGTGEAIEGGQAKPGQGKIDSTPVENYCTVQYSIYSSEGMAGRPEGEGARPGGTDRSN